jgi:AcrR family transcriptional regulator
MRSAPPLRDRPLEDLTARARIRDVALKHFAERGVDGTTIRGIATDAGVSAGLVQHHFGSKEELRAACDTYVMHTIRRDANQALHDRRLDDPTFIADTYATAPPIMGYLARALVDASPAAAALFDEMVALTEQYLVSTGRFASDSADVRAYAAVFTAMKLGVTVFLDQLSRTLSITDMARDGYPRISRAMLDIISPDFVSRDMADQARAGLDRYAQEHPNV